MSTLYQWQQRLMRQLSTPSNLLDFFILICYFFGCLATSGMTFDRAPVSIGTLEA